MADHVPYTAPRRKLTLALALTLT